MIAVSLVRVRFIDLIASLFSLNCSMRSLMVPVATFWARLRLDKLIKIQATIPLCVDTFLYSISHFLFF